MASPVAFDLAINAWPGDTPWLEQTVRHLCRSVSGARPASRRLVIDVAPDDGPYARRKPYPPDEVFAIGERLLRDRIIDEVVRIPWDNESRRQTMTRWYDDPEFPPYDVGGGTANYPYCVAVDTCTADYVLHFDCDMLAHFPDGGRWIWEAIELLAEADDLIVAQPLGGPAKSETVGQFVLGPRSRSTESDRSWHIGGDLTSRLFVMDRRRLADKLLPLLPNAFGERWEQSMTHTAPLKNLHRATLQDQGIYAIHPLSHNRRYINELPGLIWAIENGVCPFRRRGNAWDIRTDYKSYWPWWVAIRYARVAQRFGSLKPMRSRSVGA